MPLPHKHISRDDAREMYELVMCPLGSERVEPSPHRSIRRRGIQGSASVKAEPYRAATSIFLILVTASISGFFSTVAVRAELASERAAATAARQDAEAAVLRVADIETVLSDVLEKESQILDAYVEALNNERWFDAHMNLYELALRMEQYPDREAELAGEFRKAVELAADTFSNEGGTDDGRAE